MLVTLNILEVSKNFFPRLYTIVSGVELLINIKIKINSNVAVGDMISVCVWSCLKTTQWKMQWNSKGLKRFHLTEWKVSGANSACFIPGFGTAALALCVSSFTLSIHLTSSVSISITGHTWNSWRGW